MPPSFGSWIPSRPLNEEFSKKCLFGRRGLIAARRMIDHRIGTSPARTVTATYAVSDQPTDEEQDEYESRLPGTAAASSAAPATARFATFFLCLFVFFIHSHFLL